LSNSEAENPIAVVEKRLGSPLNGSPVDHSLRFRQQEILSELGVLALHGTPLRQLLDETERLTADGLEAEFCKILEYRPADKRFLVTAGVGWDVDVIGVATVGADMESPAGFALVTGKPVISDQTFSARV
jgi:hypothetical protein